MELDEASGSAQEDDRPTGLSPQVLDYYKRFGRHRDLEQYFSLTTIQGEEAHPSGMFWSSMKSASDSDIGGKKDTVTAEVCRISISCAVADPCSSQEGTSTSEKQEPDSPPIISEDQAPPAPALTPVEDDDVQKSDLDTSRKSVDLNLDSSTNKPLSPTSSITSQRKLEWDSLADVGYPNENERKVSSSLSTLERLALQQQFSDEMKNENISGHPTAFSTPLDDDCGKCKGKKNTRKDILKKVTKVSQKDVDVMELNVDRGETSNVLPTNINVSLTKHISFNVDPETGAASLANSKIVNKTDNYKNIVTGVTTDAAVGTQETSDKEIQTSHDAGQIRSDNIAKRNPDKYADCIATVPVFLNLDMLKQTRYRGLKYYRTKINSKQMKRCAKQQPKPKKEKRAANEQLENRIPASEVTIGGSQVSETDSFEYMPAHVYHQNTARNNSNEGSNTGTSDKTSSLESSGGYTTLSSKQSEHSFNRDLEKSIALLNQLVQHRHKDTDMKKKLVKEVVQRLIKTNYRDDDTTTDFLTGLSFNSKILGLGCGDKPKYQTTTSTSDGNNSEIPHAPKARKSILRSPKSSKSANPSAQVAQLVGQSSAQIDTGKPCCDNVQVPINAETAINTGSGEHSRAEKSTSEGEFRKTSSEVLYQRYLEALNREEKYKEQLKIKQDFLKHKLTQRETPQGKVKSLKNENLRSSSLKDLMKDLTKNSLCNAGGDAGLKAVSVHSNPETERNNISKKMRSHSVFTISSGISEKKNMESSSRKQSTLETQTDDTMTDVAQTEKQPHRNNVNIFERSTLSKPSKLNLHYCCCPYHGERKVGTVIQPSKISKNVAIQKDIPNSSDELTHNLSSTSKNQFICVCNSDGKVLNDFPDDFLIYKCCRLHLLKTDSDVHCRKSTSVQCSAEDIYKSSPGNDHASEVKLTNTNVKENSKPVYQQIYYQNKSQITDHSTSDQSEKQKAKRQEIIQTRDKHFPRCSNLGDVRVYSVPQSARTNTNMHSKFNETLSLNERQTSNYCVDTHMQTSVSIDPRVSEPTLADINVFHEDNLTSNVRIQEAESSKQMDTYVKEPYVNPIAIQHHYQTTNCNKDNIFKKQVETDAIIDSILQSDVVSTKSKDSSGSQQFVDGLFAYLDAEKYDESDVNAIQVVTSEGMNTDIIYTDDKGTSVTDLEKSKSPIHDVKNSPVLNRRTSDSACQSHSKSREIWTQVTPRDDRSRVIDQIDQPKTQESNESGKSSDIKFDDQDDVLKDKPCNNYTTEWIDSRYQEVNNTDNTLLERRTSKSETIENTPDTKFKNNEAFKQASLQIISNTETECSNGRKGKECFPKDPDKTKRMKKPLRPYEPKSSEGNSSASTVTKEALLESIEDIIKRYGKDEKQVIADKKSRQRHYQDIINKLHYLLRTDKIHDNVSRENSCNGRKVAMEIPKASSKENKDINVPRKTVVDKATQLRNDSSHCQLPRERIVYTSTRPKAHRMLVSEDSSDVLVSSDMPETSSDTFTCQIIRRIKKECEKFHLKHCQCTQYFEKMNARYEASSSSSVKVAKDDRVNHCSCKSSHRCRNKNSKIATEKLKKKSIAYNLIIQPSDSIIYDDNVPEREKKKLKDVVVRVPSKYKSTHGHIPENYSQSKVEHTTDQYSYPEKPKLDEPKRSEDNSEDSENIKEKKSTSVPDDSEISGSGEVRKIKFLTVREYLERNRPDFLSNTNERQSCLRVVRESRQRQQSAQRELLSVQLVQHSDATSAGVARVRELARKLGEELRSRRPEAKFLNEHNMKWHSRRIYKSLPEVLQKKEKLKKDQIKKTNSVMTSLFNKNLQKRALRGTVDISNYSPVIKI